MHHNLTVEIVAARETQNSIAAALGITPTTLSLKFNGKYELKLGECKKIKDFLHSDKSIEYLFSTEDS